MSRDAIRSRSTALLKGQLMSLITHLLSGALLDTPQSMRAVLFRVRANIHSARASCEVFSRRHHSPYPLTLNATRVRPI